MQKNKKMSGGKKVAVGTGMLVLGAASAGAYYLFGPKAKTHQKKASALMMKMKKEVEKEVKKVKTEAIPAYHKIVDTVSSKYTKQYKIHEKDAKAFAKKLKGEWKKIKK